MKIINKKNINLFIMILLTILFLYAFLVTKKDFDSMYNFKMEACQNNCQSIKQYDTFTVFFTTLMNSKINWINYFLIVFLVVAGIIDICKMRKSKMIINVLNRSNYKKVIKREFINCYKAIFIILIPLFILFIASFMYARNFDYSTVINSGMYYFFYTSSKPIIFIIAYFICMVLFFITYINIGLIIARKNYNIIVVVIESFLSFIAIDIITEIGIGFGLSSLIFKGYSSRFNLINILNVGYANNYIEMFLLPCILVIISFIVLILVYNKKEKFIIDCEKNS